MHEEFLSGERLAVEPRSSAGEAPAPVNCSLVMVVASSAVNRIVVSRIIERAGLKVAACEADGMLELLRSAMPCVVVAEEGEAEAGWMALQGAAQTRNRSDAGLPFVVALSRPGSEPAGCRIDGDADAVVAMPITPDGLAPVVLQLVERARRLAAS